MFRGRKPLWIVVIAIFGVVLLGGIWTYALGGLAKITNVKLMDENTDGYIVTELDGDTPINPKYNDGTVNFDDTEMYEATEVYISPSGPFVVIGVPVPGQKVVSATFGASWNRWVTMGGVSFWVAP